MYYCEYIMELIHFCIFLSLSKKSQRLLRCCLVLSCAGTSLSLSWIRSVIHEGGHFRLLRRFNEVKVGCGTDHYSQRVGMILTVWFLLCGTNICIRINCHHTIFVSFLDILIKKKMKHNFRFILVLNSVWNDILNVEFNFINM